MAENDLSAQARALLARADRATLATLAEDGAPYASLVLPAFAADGAPLLLISGLAEHTKNLTRDPRASLFFDGTAGLFEPLTGPRLTLMGRAAPSAAEDDRRRYLERWPSAADFAGFADFAVWRLAIDRVHFVGGFGRIGWLDWARVRPAAP